MLDLFLSFCHFEKATYVFLFYRGSSTAGDVYISPVVYKGIRTPFAHAASGEAGSNACVPIFEIKF